VLLFGVCSIVGVGVIVNETAKVAVVVDIRVVGTRAVKGDCSERGTFVVRVVGDGSR
jgi:hypothetical protein